MSMPVLPRERPQQVRAKYSVVVTAAAMPESAQALQFSGLVF